MPPGRIAVSNPQEARKALSRRRAMGSETIDKNERGRTLSVVIVDDESDLLTMYAELVRRMGLRVVGLCDRGDAAVVLIRELKPDLVVLDLGLPGLSGVEVIAEVRRSNQETKFIAVTAHSSGSLFDGALAAGVSYVKKPYVTDLQAAIEAEFEGLQYLAPRIARTVVQGYLKTVLTERIKTERIKKDDEIRLTDRQREVADLITQGLVNKEIAVRLGLAVRTVEVHRALLMRLLGVKNTAELVARWLRNPSSPRRST
jgi:DNA-binding NarL/FixJ family response regulator